MQATAQAPNPPPTGSGVPLPRKLVPASPAGELAVALIRLFRQLRSLHGADPAMACLSTIIRLGPIRVSTLAEELALDISTASRHVGNLETAQLLAREPDPADLRATLLTVTPAGLEHFRQGMHKRTRALAAATAAWPEPDLATLTTLTNRLAESLGALIDTRPGPDPGARP